MGVSDGSLRGVADKAPELISGVSVQKPYVVLSRGKRSRSRTPCGRDMYSYGGGPTYSSNTLF